MLGVVGGVSLGFVCALGSVGLRCDHLIGGVGVVGCSGSSSLLLFGVIIRRLSLKYIHMASRRPLYPMAVRASVLISEWWCSSCLCCLTLSGLAWDLGVPLVFLVFVCGNVFVDDVPVPSLINVGVWAPRLVLSCQDSGWEGGGTVGQFRG